MLNNYMKVVYIALLIAVLITTIYVLFLRKRNLSKIKHYIIGEFILLLLCIAISSMFYILVKKNIDVQVENVMSITNERVSQYSNIGYSPEEILDEVLFTYTEGMNTDGKKGNNFDCLYINLQAYNSEGNLYPIQCIPTSVCIMYTYRDNNLVDAITCYPETDLIYQLTGTYLYHDTGESVKYIKGYYNEENVFIITEIALKNTSNVMTRTIGNNSDTNITYYAGENEDGNEYEFNLYLFSYNANFISEEFYMQTNAYDKTSNGVITWSASDGIFTYSFDKNNTNFQYQLEMYANTSSMALSSTNFKIYSISTFVMVHLIAFIAYRAFKLYNKKKEQLEQEKDTFINAIAHEMKTPAAIIQNSSEMIKENLYPEKKDHYIEIMHDEATNINELLQQMLAYTRTNDSYPLQIKEIHLLDLVNQVLQHYEITQQLSIDIPSNTTIQCDSKLISVVIDNFISNAIRYSDDLISIKYTDHTFTIYNSGSHISEEDLKHIWEPLYKADSSRNNTNTTGMGLAISANILKLHHFKYGCHQLEDGIEFYFKVK